MTDAVNVAPDGSPVEVYLRRSPGEVPRLVHEAIPPDATVLDLGCGVGRLARPLAELGHRVTGVDESAAMLAHADGFETVRSKIEELDLCERFDAVLLASLSSTSRTPGNVGTCWQRAGAMRPNAASCWSSDSSRAG